MGGKETSKVKIPESIKSIIIDIIEDYMGKGYIAIKNNNALKKFKSEISNWIDDFEKQNQGTIICKDDFHKYIKYNKLIQDTFDFENSPTISETKFKEDLINRINDSIINISPSDQILIKKFINTLMDKIKNFLNENLDSNSKRLNNNMNLNTEKIMDGINSIKNNTQVSQNDNQETRIPIYVKNKDINIEGDNNIDYNNIINLVDKFNGRHLKDGFDWNEIYKNYLKKDLLEKTKCRNNKYELFMTAPLSIAFACGRILNPKSCVDIVPMQRTDLWNYNYSDKNLYPEFQIKTKIINEKYSDCALITQFNRSNVLDDVIKGYIENKKTKIGKIICCTLGSDIENGTHAKRLSEQVCREVSTRSFDERNATLHIFPEGPVGFLFYLGQGSLNFGKCVLYEYDLEKTKDGSYTPSISFPEAKN